MKVLLVGGPLDGQRVEVSDAQANFISSQNADPYVRAIPGVFISTAIPQEDMTRVLAEKLVEGYNRKHCVGMALAQLDDAAMYAGPAMGKCATHIASAREILRHG